MAVSPPHQALVVCLRTLQRRGAYFRKRCEGGQERREANGADSTKNFMNDSDVLCDCQVVLLMKN